MKRLALVLVVACGAHPRQPLPGEKPHVVTGAEHMLALLPDGAQLIVELDLERLRANPVVGDLASKALVQLGAATKLPGLQGSPLAGAQQVVMAAYGVGTTQAATLTLIKTKETVAASTKIGEDLVAVGPEDWIRQVEARAAVDAQHALVPPVELLRLRDHAMPQGATGAVIRVTARLGFDARIAFARQTGLDAAPAQLSIWGDVADDLAIVIDADASDGKDKDAARRLAHTLRGTLGAIAEEPIVRALGVPTSLTDARLVTQGTWVRAVMAVGPRHLARAVERARAMLGS